MFKKPQLTYLSQVLLGIATMTASVSSMANLGRDDILYDNYIDFGMQRGKYQPGTKNIIVYYKDGRQAGIIPLMPDWYGTSDRGSVSLFGDNQVVATAAHVTTPIFTINKRFYRTDIPLFKDSDKIFTTATEPEANKQSKELYNRFSEIYRPSGASASPGDDYFSYRVSTLVFDGIAHATATQDEVDKLQNGSLVARIGGGDNFVARHNESEAYARPDGYISGGLNKISDQNKLASGVKRVNARLRSNAATALDSISQPDDSGSPLYWYDTKSETWKYFGVVSAGSGDTYNSAYTRFLSDPSFTKNFVDNLNQQQNESNYTLDTGSDTHHYRLNNQDLTNVDSNANSYAKNQVFTKDVILTVTGAVNTGAARFEFNNNATINATTAESKLDTAGVIIAQNKTLHYNLNLQQGQNLRKIGKGTLIIGNSPIQSKDSTSPVHSNNDGVLSVGEGLVELNHQGGYAASNIKIASGRGTVKLLADNQINGSNVSFGVLGGELDLNGHDLSFNEIYHADKGATIANSNSSKVSNFTFTNSEKRVFLGNFKGHLNVTYNPSNPNTDTVWELRSTATDIKGDLNIKVGKVNIAGDNYLTGYVPTVVPDRFYQAHFNATNINIADNTSLTIKRASQVNSNINVADKGELILQATGALLTDTPLETQDQDKDFIVKRNKIQVSGGVNFGNSVKHENTDSTLTSTETTSAVNSVNDKVVTISKPATSINNINFQVHLDPKHQAEISGKLTGVINAQQTGPGTLYVHSTDNSKLTGRWSIADGSVRFDHASGIGSVVFSTDLEHSHSGINPTQKATADTSTAIVQVNNVSNEDQDHLLDHFDHNFAGVLSLNKDLTTLSKKFANYSNLYIGTQNSDSAPLTIGQSGKAFDKDLTTLNLGGDGGTIKVLGLDADNTTRTINIGNKVATGKVIIDSIKKDNNISINANGPTILEITHNSKDTAFINLGYGAITDSSNLNSLKAESRGTIAFPETPKVSSSKIVTGEHEGDFNLSSLPNISLGALYHRALVINKLTGSNAYRIGGEGYVIFNDQLETGKDLIVDGQYHQNGNLYIYSNNQEYKGNITIQGNNQAYNPAQKTGDFNVLTMNSSALGVGNTITLRNGGRLNLFGHDLDFKLGADSNEAGEIYSQGISNKNLHSTITFENDQPQSVDSSKVGVVITPKITGDFDLVFNGTATVGFNPNHVLTANYTINHGALDNSQLNFVSDSENRNRNLVTINQDGALHLHKDLDTRVIVGQSSTNGVSKFINADGQVVADDTNTATITTTGNKGKYDITIGSLEAQADTRIIGDNSVKLHLPELQLHGHTLTLKHQDTEIGANPTGGKLDVYNSTLYTSGYNNKLFHTDNYNVIALHDSQLVLHDYAANNGSIDSKVANTRVELFGKNQLSANGGAGTVINEHFNLQHNASLAFNYSTGQGQYRWALKLNPTITGDESTSLYFHVPYFIHGFDFYNNLAGFKGKLNVKLESDDERYKIAKGEFIGFNITATNDADRTLNFAIVNEGRHKEDAVLKNQSDQDLIFENIKDYTGTLVSEAGKGNLVLSGVNALQSYATIKSATGKVIWQVKEGQEVQAENLTLVDTRNDNQKAETGAFTLVKTGTGKVAIGDNLHLNDVTNYDVQAGTLALQATPKSTFTGYNSGITYNLSSASQLTLASPTDFNFNAQISGNGKVVLASKAGNTVTTHLANLQHTGSVQLQTGNLTIKLSQASNALKQDFYSATITSPTMDSVTAGVNTESLILAKTITPKTSIIETPATTDSNILSFIIDEDHRVSSNNNPASVTIGQHLQHYHGKVFVGNDVAIDIDQPDRLDSGLKFTNTPTTNDANTISHIASIRNVSGKDLVIGDNFSDFTGKLVAQHGNLKIANNIVGTSNQYEVVGGDIIFNTLQSNSDAISTPIRVSEDRPSQIQTASLAPGNNIQFVTYNRDANYNSQESRGVNLDNVNFINNSDDHFFVNHNAGTVIFGKDTAKKLRNYQQDEGILRPSEDIELQKFRNNAELDLGTHNFTAQNYYQGNQGFISLTVDNGATAPRIKLAHTNQAVRLKLTNGDKLAKQLQNQVVPLAVSNKGIQVTNLDALNQGHSIKLTSVQESNMVYLTSQVDHKALGMLHMLATAEVLNQLPYSYQTFKNTIGIRRLNANFQDKEFKPYPNATSTWYKNSSNVNGLAVNFGVNTKYEGWNINPIIDLAYADLYTTTQVVGQDNIAIKGQAFNTKILLNLKPTTSNFRYGSSIAWHHLSFSNDKYGSDTVNVNYLDITGFAGYNLIRNWNLGNTVIAVNFGQELGVQYHNLVDQSLAASNFDPDVVDINTDTPYGVYYQAKLATEVAGFDLSVIGRIQYTSSQLKVIAEKDTLVNKLTTPITWQASVNLGYRFSKYPVRIGVQTSIDNFNRSRNTSTQLTLDYNW